MKYIDPSGHDVDICPDIVQEINTYFGGDIFAWGARVREFGLLYSAWLEFSEICPGMASFLETSPCHIVIGSALYGEGIGGAIVVNSHAISQETGFDVATSISITINYLYLFSLDFSKLIGNLAHECFHATVRCRYNMDDTWLEEAFAYKFGWAVESVYLNGAPNLQGYGGVDAIFNNVKSYPFMTQGEINQLTIDLRKDELWKKVYPENIYGILLPNKT